MVIVFWLAGFALVYTYVIYPSLVAFWARGKSLPRPAPPAVWPHVSILMAVHNEEAVIEEKLRSLLAQDYPEDRLHFYIGSDNSSDQTNSIVAAFAQREAKLHFFPFPQRQGKPGVINQLATAAAERQPQSAEHLFIITDASVMLSPGVTKALARHFDRPNLAIVDAHMIHTGMDPTDISDAENSYISWEGRLKYHESVLWQQMIGPFGGCYALRSDFFVPVPDNFLVDDFYITMQAFRKGGLAITEPNAHCYEPVGHEIREEFRRKSRISAGNVQNMLAFTDLWLPPWGMPNFAFFSHKIIRWLGPIWLILLMLSAGLLANNYFYAIAFGCLGVGYFLIPLFDEVLMRFGFHWSLARNVRYFLVMNLALLKGYFRYAKGIQSNVWQPPKRQ
ncbi:MAG: glycosyltransferase [Bacteroidota bacterium]